MVVSDGKSVRASTGHFSQLFPVEGEKITQRPTNITLLFAAVTERGSVVVLAPVLVLASVPPN
jgi:hypothetical protein